MPSKISTKSHFAVFTGFSRPREKQCPTLVSGNRIATYTFVHSCLGLAEVCSCFGWPGTLHWYNCDTETIPVTTAPQARSANRAYKAPRRRLSSKKLAFVAVLIGLEFLVFWRRGANNRDKAAPSAATFVAPGSPPQSVLHQRNQLKEGESATHSFFLAQNARVHIEITATPKPVDVMVMTSDEAAKFQQGQGKFFAFLAPEYTYRQTLSAQDVSTMDRSDILPPGNWVIVITLPRQAVFFKKDTAVSTILTIY